MLAVPAAIAYADSRDVGGSPRYLAVAERSFRRSTSWRSAITAGTSVTKDRTAALLDEAAQPQPANSTPPAATLA